METGTPSAAAPQIPPPSGNKLQLITLVVVLILFVAFMLWGISSGISTAQSQATLNNAGAVYDALKYYQKDQGNYPTPSNFGTLVPYYLDQMPVPQDASGSCSAYNQFQYDQTQPQNFELKFCLTKAFSGFPAAVSVFDEKSSE